MIEVVFMKGRQRLILKYPFSRETNELVKKIDGYSFHREQKFWSIPYNQFDRLLEVFDRGNLEIHPNIMEQYKLDHMSPRERLKLVKLEDESFQFKTSPYPHQIECFNIGTKKDSLLIADDQGLGKTMEAANIAVYRKLNNDVKKCLVVCGVNSVKYNWQKELAIHTNESCSMIDGNGTEKRVKQINDWLAGDNFFGVINIEALRKSEITDALKPIDMVIIDEIHKAKNPRSQQGEAIHLVKPRYRIGLTGTPITSDVMDLYNILTYLGVEERPYYKFRNRYCEMGGFKDKEIIGYKNLSELNDILKSAMVRRKKEDVVDLPEKIHSTQYVDLTTSEMRNYLKARLGILKRMDEIMDTSNPLTELLRLRQVTSGLFEDHTKSSKLESVKMMLEETILPNDEKTIIFSNWEQVTELYKEALSEYNPTYITGNLTPAERQVEVDRFQNDPDCKIIIGTIGAMGTGLTLNKASNVIFLDKSWTYADTLQAEDRAHRIGSESVVHVISMVAKDTVDEYMEKHLEENKDMFQKVVEGESIQKEEVKKIFCEALGVTEAEMKKYKKEAKKKKEENRTTLDEIKEKVASARENEPAALIKATAHSR